MRTFDAAALSVLLVAGLPPADSPAGDEFSSVETVAGAGTRRVPAPPAGAREGDWYAVGPTETVILEDEIDLDGGSSTTAPSSTKADREKDTRCYKTPIKLHRVVNGKSQYVKTRYPRVAVSMNNKVVVTSYPTSTPSC